MNRHFLCVLALALFSFGFHFDIKAEIFIQESFSNPTLPSGWTNTAIQGSAVWQIKNSPFFNSSSGGYYAVFDDFVLGGAVTPNEAALTTRSFNCTENTNVKINFKHYWEGVEGTRGYIEVSNNGGTSWNTVITYGSLTRGSFSNPQDTIIDISAFAANQSDVKIRFRYSDGGFYGKYWYIDDIVVYSNPDVGITSLVSPWYLSCGEQYSSNQNITVRIKNFGNEPVSNIPVVCNISGGIITTLSQTYTGTIPPNSFVDFTFSSTVNMSADACYDFQIYTNFAGDANSSNNTHITSRQQLVQTFPYFQNFNNGAGGFNADGDPPSGSDTERGREFVYGVLPYLNGPEGEGNSWYVDVTTHGRYYRLWIESPVFDFSNNTNPVLSFDIKYQLSSFYTQFHVEYTTDGGISWNTLGTDTDPLWYQGNTSWWYNNYNNPVDNWTYVEKTLCNLAGQSCVKFRIFAYAYYGINGTYDYTDRNRIAFDNILISDTPFDAELLYAYGCWGSEYNLEVQVKNNNNFCIIPGTINSINLTYSIDGGTPVTGTFTGLNIPPGGVQTVIIPNVTVNSNASTVKIWCSLPNGVVDQIPFNDTILVSFANFPNCNDHCSNAIELTLGTTSASQTSFATANSAEDPSFSNCSGVTLENTVWYFFTTTAEGGDVTLTFQNTVCSPSSNGIQVSVDQLIGTPCDPAGYVNVFCSNSGSTNDIVWGPVNLPGNTTYYITIDGYANNDCDFQISLQGAVTPPPVPEDPVVSAIPNPICEGQSSTITATSAGAQFCYVYSDPVGGTNLGATPLVVSPTSTTTYYVEAVSDMGIVNAGGRTPITITVNSQPDASISPVGTLCKNDSPIILTSSTAGGTWSGTGITDSANGIFNPALANTGNNLISYEVTVNGCTATHNIIIVVNENPMPNVNPSNSEICSGDFVTLTASGGNNYLWSTTENTASINVSPILNTTYYVTVTNAEGCSADASVTVTVNSLPAANITATQTAICEGGSTTLTASGGTGYVWNTGETTSNITVNPSATTTYYVTVINSTGCSSQASQTITVNSIPVASVNPGSTTICEGESVTITATGGTGYIWNTTETTSSITVTPTSTTTYSVTVSNAAGCTVETISTINVSSPITPTFSSIGPYCEGDAPSVLPVVSTNGIIGTWSPTNINTTVSGTTTYNFTPSSGQCAVSSSIDITVNSLPQIQISPSNPYVCSGSDINLIASGGISYLWNNGNSSANINVQPLVNTVYSVTGTDVNGCSSIASVEVIVRLLPEIYVSSLVSPTCNGYQNGSISVSHTGTGNVSYNWTGYSTGNTLNNVGAGIYNVTGTDEYGCSSSLTITLTEPAELIACISSINNLSCQGNSDAYINVFAQGGTEPYTFVWDYNNFNGNIISGLPAGVYNLTVTDFNNCFDYLSIEILDAIPIKIIAEVSNVSCYGEKDGKILVNVQGGIAPYSYQINSNLYNTNLINSLNPGEYNIIVSDFNNCKSDTTVIISEPPPLNVSVVVTHPTCIGNNNGMIELGVSGGEYPYNYIVNGISSESPIIANLTHGSYFITVQDNNSCEYKLTNIMLTDYPEDCIRIPNAFTPNGDGINDFWVIENIELFPDAIVQVFNRWGQLVFETRDPNISWDGKFNNRLLPTGTYIYIININNNDKTYNGTVTIVR